MRLKARIINPTTLYSLTACLEKLVNSCILRLTPTHIYFIVKDHLLQVWCRVPTPYLFDPLQIESANKNEIYLHVPLPGFSRALKSMQHASKAQLKLTTTRDTDQPILVLLMDTESRKGHPIHIEHSVPVVPLKYSACSMKQPQISQAALFITLPNPLLLLKAVVEKFKSMATAITVSANRAGSLMLAIDEANVRIQTVIHHLHIPESVDHSSNHQPSTLAPGEYVSVTLCVREFAKFLNCSAINPVHVVFGIHPGICAVFYVHMFSSDTSATNNTVLTYYIPIKLP